MSKLIGRMPHSSTAAALHTQNVVQKRSAEEVRSVWKHADAVCFDVDSTVCQDEAIDELAAFCGVGEQVAQVTLQAMNGGLSFHEALAMRLRLINPSIYQLDQFLRKQPPMLTSGIRELIAELHSRRVTVYLVSGGFTRIILPVARALGIPEENVYANVLKFDEEGNYAGFDETQPTCSSGGKGVVCGLLKNRFGYKRLVMIGDGATDMEASPPADAFIGFGGNQIRERVKKESSWFVTSFNELLNELKFKI